MASLPDLTPDEMEILFKIDRWRFHNFPRKPSSFQET